MRISPGYLPDPQTEYEAKAVEFCRDWLSGQATFTLQTSGSTGTPKLIRLSRRQMAASARLTGQTFGLQPGDRALVCLNVGYIAGVMMLVRGLELGLTLTVVEPASNPFQTLNPDIPAFEFAAFVPLQLQTLLDTPKQSLPVLNRMKAILVGGAAVDRGLANRLQIIESPVFSTYGMTETVSHIAIRRLNGPEHSEVFRALDGVELGVDERHCLNIKAAATDFETVQTNDVVELLDSQHFRLLGRADFIINSGGVKIQPERVEEVIAKLLAGPQRFFVYGLPDERLGQQVALFIEAENDWPETVAQAIKNRVRAEIGPYAVPRSIFFMSSFPKTPTGKIDKKRVVEGHIR
ncbi:AMP-binding protein [Larkinella sp. VNQ87]|uniref:AMP-binding protein n=1 Tax=Larkinella sp. VNQ87 TaxID=3400921 RepID=UPI003BFFC68A